MQLAPTPRVDAPRFDLLFEQGRASLRLRRPVHTPLLRVRALELRFELPTSAVVLTGDARRFRTRASTLVSARVELSRQALGVIARERGLRVTVDQLNAEELALSFEDLRGVIHLRLRLGCAASDLIARPSALEAIGDPRSAWSRVLGVAAILGAPWDPERAAFVWSDPVRALLLKQLAMHGWRAPGTQSTQLSLAATTGGIALLASLDPVAPLAEPPPALSALEALPQSQAFLAWQRAQTPEEAAAAADTLHHSRWLRSAAFEVCARRGVGHPAQVEWVLEALERAPEDVERWRSWLDLVGESDVSGLLSLADVIIAGALPRAQRVELAAQAVGMALDRRQAQALGPEVRTRAEAILARCAELGGGAFVDAARARLSESRAQAVEAFLRAADAADDPARAAKWLWEAAKQALQTTTPEAWTIEPWLQRAREALGDRPSLLVDLARATARRSEAEAEELLGLLLRRGGEEAAPEQLAALLAAARYHRDQGSPERAKPFERAAEHARRSAMPAPPLSAPLMRAEAFTAHEDAEVRPDLAQTQLVQAPQVTQLVQTEILDARAREGAPPLAPEAEDDESRERFEAKLWQRQAFSSPDNDAAEDEADDQNAGEELEDGGCALEDESAAYSRLDAPKISDPNVTQIGMADSEVRELLAITAASSDAGAFLEGVLDAAHAELDVEGVRRVIEVLERLGDFPGSQKLLQRARRVHAQFPTQ